MSESKRRIPKGAPNARMMQCLTLSSSRTCAKEHIKRVYSIKKTIFGVIVFSVPSSLIVISSSVAVSALSSSVAASTTAVSSAEAPFLFILFAA